MAIDPYNPLLNGPRRIDARPVLRLEPSPQLFVEPPAAQVAPVSTAEIMAARTPKGSWTRATLARWGVAWPPPQGWKERLLKGLPQEPSRVPAAVPQLPLPLLVGGSPAKSAPRAGGVPNPGDPDFDSTKHGLLAPPKITYRRVGE